ncbi:MAG: tetratricopeptide repeat protein [Myxococcales bacterium]|nr:tetratricopeptide repeat protein [Myxococcales bacterium]
MQRVVGLAEGDLRRLLVRSAARGRGGLAGAAAPRPLRPLARRLGRGRGLRLRPPELHRDFKPDNVLLGDDGRARVADFGLAHAFAGTPATLDDEAGSPGDAAPSGPSSATQAGALMGSLHYMSPEQHRGEVVDARSDQFSFCVSLWEALYGASPFPATSPEELRARVLAGAIARPIEGARVPTALRRVALRGLQVDPTRRYPDMAALLADLERAGRRRAPAALVGGVIALVGGLALALALRAPAADDPCEQALAEAEAAWGDAQRAAVRRAFLATGRADAGAIWTQVASRLDAYASAWATERQAACVAAQSAEGSDSSEVAHLQIACLDRGLGELRALVDALTHDPDALLDNAVKAALKLRPLTSCRDDPGQALLVRSADPAVVARAQALADRLDEVAARLKAGDVEHALPEAQETVDEAAELGDDATSAEALVLLGSLQSQARDYASAEATLFAAALAAERGGNVSALARARTELVVAIGYGQGRTDEALRWGDLALNALRPGTDAGVEVRLRTALGLVHTRRGDRPAAEGELARALTLAEATLGPEHIGVATILDHLAGVHAAADERDEARALLRRALKIRARALGAAHPDTQRTQASLDALAG